jgi:hypothetical protein
MRPGASGAQPGAAATLLRASDVGSSHTIPIHGYWRGWEHLDGQLNSGDGMLIPPTAPTTGSRSAGTVDVFAHMTDDGQWYQKSFNGTSWSDFILRPLAAPSGQAHSPVAITYWTPPTPTPRPRHIPTAQPPGGV